MANETKGTTKLGTMPIPKLLINMGAPMMLSMFCQAFYNVVDTFFVSRIPDTESVADMGDKAINALTLAFPIQMLIICLGVGTAVGTTSSLAMYFGKRDRERANKTAGNSFFIYICYYLALLLFGIFGSRPFILSQTSDPVISAMGIQYLSIVTILSFGCLGFMDLEKKMLAMGHSKLAMTGQLTGALINIGLDPVLIFGPGPFPEMGVLGAAYATVIGQIASFILLGIFYFRDHRQLDHGLRYLRPCKPIIARIYKVGLPTVIMQSLTSVMSYGMNLILGALSESAVTAFGVYFKLQSFIFMPAFGMMNGVVPTVSYNYGAANKKRIEDTIRYGLLYVGIIMAVGIVIIQMFTSDIVQIFSLSPESKRLTILALRIVSCGFMFAAGGIVLSGVCQGLGNGTISLIIAIIRLIVVVLPCAYLLSRLPGGVDIVWIAFPIADLLSTIVAIFLTKRLYHDKCGSFADRPVAVQEG